MNVVLDHLCVHNNRLNWARRISWGWWDKWDDTALQTHNYKHEPCRSETEHATTRLRRSPTILNHYEWAEKGEGTFCFFETWRPEWGSNPRSLTFPALTTAPALPFILIENAAVVWSHPGHDEPTQSTVQPVSTRHRRYSCIKMQTALSGNTRTWPNVVSILVQGRRWGGGGGANPRVCWAPHRCLSTPTPPLQNISASRSGYF